VSLFAEAENQAFARVAPLALRMRPRTLEEMVGQRHFLGPGKLLRRLLAADRLGSVILYGPPGTGKTTLARVIANTTRARFVTVNATSSGVKELREVIERATGELAANGTRTILFIDEIHRFNRAQQDVLLPDVEAGRVTLIGATTQNPFFSIVAPLVSRSQVFQFDPLTEDDVLVLLRRALTDAQRGLGKMNVQVAEEALAHWAKVCDGDARRALTGLEVAVRSTPPDADGRIAIDLRIAEESIQRKSIEYDATGDAHYDAASAFIKSMRGSDPDAAVYWMARMLEAGEDPRFIARRMVICAAEDVGLADPMALVVANAALQGTEFVGLPECQLLLSEAVIYIAVAPKSNAAATAIWEAAADVKAGRVLPVPRHLRDSSYRSAKRLGHGKGYRYAHDHEDGFVVQDYLGVEKHFYKPTDRGHEKRIAARLRELARRRERQPQDRPGRPPATQEDADA
jgi:putative ATPase